MQLLVSVADPWEARAALTGGADVVDAKDPRRGALGAVAPHQLRAICAAVGGERPVSAALGDARQPSPIARAARAAVAAGATYVKVGFRGSDSAAQVRPLAAAVRAGDGLHVILVAYADWERVGAPPPAVVVDVAVSLGVAGVLMDTAFKGTGLFEVASRDVVGTWVAAARRAGLLTALAGGLDGADLHLAREAGAHVVGVRGAACDGGRTGRVSVSKVAALSALTARASLPSLARV